MISQTTRIMILRNIRQLAVDAIRSNAAIVSIPVRKSTLPTGAKIHLGDDNGPRGEWHSVDVLDSGFVVVADFKPLAVLLWVDKTLSLESAAA